MTTLASILFCCFLALWIWALVRLYRKGNTSLFRTGMVASCFLGVVAVSVICYCDRQVCAVANGKCYSSISNCPSMEWGILLGTGRNRRPNEYYDARVASTIALYQAGKVRHIFISGENLYADYHEVDSLYAVLTEAGIPADSILTDTQGVDTYRTLLHAQEMVGADSYLLISQHFHNERSLYYADQMHIEALAFDAAPHSAWYKRLRDLVREKFARVKAVLISSTR